MVPGTGAAASVLPCLGWARSHARLSGSAPPMALGLLKSNVSPIAVDFGVASLKVLQLSLGDAPALVAAASVETPEELIEKDGERLAWQAEQLPELMRGLGFKGKRAVCSVSANRTLVQHVQTPRLEGVSVFEAAKEQLRSMTGR